MLCCLALGMFSSLYWAEPVKKILYIGLLTYSLTSYVYFVAKVDPFMVRYCPYQPSDEGTYIVKVTNYTLHFNVAMVRSYESRTC